MAPPHIPFRRRQFLVKHGFQFRFAAYPLLFLSVFLLSAGGYLYWYLKDFLEFQLYLSHSQLNNPWDEIAPVLRDVVLWGGGALLAALGLWVWRRFGDLHRDLDCLAEWLTTHALGRTGAPLPAFADREMRSLGQALGAAVGALEAWDEQVEGAAAAVQRAVTRLPEAECGDRRALARALIDVHSAVDALAATVDRVSVNEELS